jgi:hypothetical protein
MTRGLVVFESMFGNTQVIGPLVDGNQNVPAAGRSWGRRSPPSSGSAAPCEQNNNRAEQSPRARAR